MDLALEIAAGLVPSIGVGLIFWFVIRAIIRADRAERAALARLDQERARRAAAPSTAGTAGTTDGPTASPSTDA